MEIIVSNLQKHSRIIFSTLVFLVLLGLSFAAKIYILPLSFGIYFAFSSVFIFLILRIFGLLSGVIASILVNVLAWLLLGWNFLYVFSFLEILFVGIGLRRNQRNMIIWDMLFWFIIGTPIIVFFQYIVRDALGTYRYIDVLKEIVNGLSNVLLADLLITYIPIRKWLGIEKKITIQFSQILWHVSIAAVVGPFLLFTIVDGWRFEDKLQREIIQIIQARTYNISEQLKNWSADDLMGIKLKSVLHMNKLKTLIDSNSSDGLLEVYVVNQSNKVYLTNIENKDNLRVYDWRRGGKAYRFSNGIYKWLPANKSFLHSNSQWTQAFYIQETRLNNIPLKLLVKLPLSKYTDDIWQYYMNKFIIVLLSSALSILISIVISKVIVKSISRLTDSTSGLPDKLKRQEFIEWSNSSIVEISSLIMNIRIMSDNLMELFSEASRINNQLKEQTVKLEKSEIRLQHLAYYDSLVDLPNRLSFMNYMSEMLKSDWSTKKNFAVMLFDLDRFKQINDALGHEVGNLLLKEVANRLKLFVEGNNFAARLSGDEFVLVLNNTDHVKIVDTAERIINSMCEAFVLNEHDHIHELFISTSIGISIYPVDGHEVDTILKNADMAMYSAKEAGGNTFCFYSRLMTQDLAERMVLEQNMRKVLQKNELLLHYQPRVDIKTGRIMGVEALVRWMHPVWGFISPGKFIPLAEETGLIIPIGQWVLLEACKQNKKWQDEGLPHIKISVNLSVRQFHGQDLVGMVRKALEETGLRPEYLELEITEGFIIKNVNYAINILRELKEIGVSISIDDFGTGYSSLNRLKYLPIYCLKIDRSFIHNISEDRYNASIVKAVTELAHSMDLRVVAEGVEEQNELKVIRDIGCDELQGYLFSRPVPKEDFEKLLVENLETDGQIFQ